MSYRDHGASGGSAWGWIAALIVVGVIIAAAFAVGHGGVEVDGVNFGLPEPFETILEVVSAFFIALAAIVVGLIGAVIGIVVGLLGALIGILAALIAVVAALTPILLPFAILIGIGVLIGRAMKRG